MTATKLIGQQAGVMKYDLLTALAAMAMRGDQRLQISMPRLCLLITARYNWRLDEFSVCQRDLARMWNVTERTVKREMRFWQDLDLVICKRRGVRGRVGAWRLNFPAIYRLSQPAWATIGPDYEERMQATGVGQGASVVALDFRTGKALENPGPPIPTETSADRSASGPWRDVRARLRDLHPAAFQNWLDALLYRGLTEGRVTLEAPSRFAGAYIETHLAGIVAEAVAAVMGPNLRIVITIAK